MNLENLETKEPIIKEFFTWLFDDSRIVDKNIILYKEIDSALVPYCKDANIYYPKQFSDFFNSRAMKRLGRISQLDLVVDEFPNAYHNRLQHSKGVYYRKLEEMLHNFQNPKWTDYIETHGMKLHLIAELFKMAGHDIGQFPLSHAFEQVIYSCHGPHEKFGQRIMLEDSEIQSILKSVSTDLPQIIKDLYDKPILNFGQHDESNYDVDRFDYLLRDNLYAGTPVILPYLHYETVHVALNDSGLPQIGPDGNIITSDESDFAIDVYDYSSLRSIEHFLEIRATSYENIYFSRKAHVRENSITALFNAFLQSDSESGKDLRKFIGTLRNCDINEVDLSIFLEWDDIKFYSEILDIAENHIDTNIRLLATMTIPNIKSFLTMLYSYLHTKESSLSELDKHFLQKVKSLIRDNNDLSNNLKFPNFAMDNTLIYPQDIPLPTKYKQLLSKGLICSSNVKIKSYNPEEPIYIKGANKKIYDLSHHPDRKYDWDTRVSYVSNMYAYIPFLRFNGISDEEIDEMRDFCNSQPSPIEFRQRCSAIFMKPYPIGKYVEYDLFDL